MSFAKVAITCEAAGDELEDYARLTSTHEYNLLNPDYTRESDGARVRLQGFATGRWSYATNLAGYLTAPEGWLSSDEQRDSFDKLMTTLRSTGAAIHFAVVDSEQGNAWLGTFEARLRVGRWGKPRLKVNTGGFRELSFDDFMAAYEFSTPQALRAFYEDEGELFLRDWSASRGESPPTEADFLAWSEADPRR